MNPHFGQGMDTKERMACAQGFRSHCCFERSGSKAHRAKHLDVSGIFVSRVKLTRQIFVTRIKQMDQIFVSRIKLTHQKDEKNK
jgi:hypothetical protein